MNESTFNKYSDIPRSLNALQASEIAELLKDTPMAVTHTNVFGLELVDEQGDVDLMATSNPQAAEGETLETVMAEVPLVRYSDNGFEHVVTLYSRNTTGYAHEAGSSENNSVFVIDQAFDQEGNAYLADTPALLHRTHSRDPEGEGIDDESQLLVATLQATGGAEGIKRLITARQAGDIHEIERLEAEMESLLRQRDLGNIKRDTRTRVHGFTELTWSRRGILSASAEQKRRDAYDEKVAQEEKTWQEMSKARKMSAWVLWRLDPGVRSLSTVQQAHSARQRKKMRTN